MINDDLETKATEFAAQGCPCGNNCEVDRILIAACKFPRRAYIAGAKAERIWWSERLIKISHHIGSTSEEKEKLWAEVQQAASEALDDQA